MTGWILIALVVVVGGGAIAFLIVRRRRAAQDESVPLPDIGDPVDYTSMPDEEAPHTLRDRFDAIPLPGKIAMIVAPLVLIGLVVLVIVVMNMGGGGGGAPSTAEQPEDAPPAQEEATPPPSITISKADMVSANSILVEAETNLAEGSEVQIELIAGGDPFEWFDPNTAKTTVSNGQIETRLNKMDNAPRATEGITYGVRIKGTSPEGNEIVSEHELTIPGPFEKDFFVAKPAADKPTPTPEPEPTPTPQQSPDDEPPDVPFGEEPTEENIPPEPSVPTARVFHGGNVRAVPGGDPVLDQVNAEESVELYERTEDGWYKVKNQRDIVGWVHGSLLEQIDLNNAFASIPLHGTTDTPSVSLPDDTIMETPAPPDALPTTEPALPGGGSEPASTGIMVGVFNGGNVRATPGGDPVIDQINAFEQVELLERSTDSVWYHIKNERGVVGWVHYSLLMQDELNAVSLQVPVAE